LSKETKIGLLVGLLFIVVFGLVLSQTATHPNPADDPAALVAGKNPADKGLGLKSNGQTPTLPTGGSPAGNAPGAGRRDGTGPGIFGGDSSGAGTGTGTGSGGTAGGANKKEPSQPNYTVRQGETLPRILSRLYGPDWTGAICVEQVLKANGMARERELRAGMQLKMPVLDRRGAQAGDTAANPTGPVGPDAGPAPTDDPRGVRSYTVARGDNFERIAKSQCGGLAAVEKIRALNPGVDSRSLKIGQVLKIPAKGGTSERTELRAE
jgi:LysM repeat protein